MAIAIRTVFFTITLCYDLMGKNLLRNIYFIHEYLGLLGTTVVLYYPSINVNAQHC